VVNLAPEAGQAVFPVDIDGNSILNEFPRRVLLPTPDASGVEPVGRPPVAIPKRPQPARATKHKKRRHT
jgi:hypothetical protein